MKNFILIFLLFIFSCQKDIRSPNIYYETFPETAQIGDPITHNVSVNDLGELFTLNSVSWQDSSLWLSDSLKVYIKDSFIDTLDTSISLSFQITFWGTGKVVIPPLYTSISFPDSSYALIFKTDS